MTFSTSGHFVAFFERERVKVNTVKRMKIIKGKKITDSRVNLSYLTHCDFEWGVSHLHVISHGNTGSTVSLTLTHNAHRELLT